MGFIIGMRRMRGFSIRKLAEALGGVFETEEGVLGYQIDSRQVQPGDLFFALKGERTDGHEHLGEAAVRGAKGAVVAKDYGGPDFGLKLLFVEEVAEALQELARFSLKERPVEIIGVTGSVGKTTTKEFIATLLSKRYRVGKSIGSYNTKLTFPLTLLNRTGDEEVLVLEMGMSEPGDLKRLLRIAAPDIAVLTNVGRAHIGFFPGGLAEIAKTKGEIFSHPKTKKAVFNHALYVYPELIKAVLCEKSSFSLEDRAADYFLSFSEGKYLVDERGVRAKQLDLPFRQQFILENLLAAIAVARAMKLEWEEIEEQIGKLQLLKMRFESFESRGIFFINDAYNANPESMQAALSSIPSPKEGGKRIGVLGTMKELGSFSEEAHREVGRAATKTLDHLLVLGAEAAPLCEGFEEAKKPVELFTDVEPLAKCLKMLMTPGDVVLIKGSRSMRMETIFDLLDGHAPPPL